MPVRKPLAKVNVEALIEKGAKVKEDKDERKWVIINLRLSSDMLKNVDECVQERVGIKRTGWILEAIREKLNKM